MKQTILMTIALACATAQGAWAESVTFNVRSWDETNKQVVTTPTTKDCTVLEGSHPDDWLGLGGYEDQNDHYYVVKGDVKYKTLNCFGRVHLILADGATLTCTGGIKVEQGNNYGKIFIYSQSDGGSEGKLVVTNSYEAAAGIGSSEGEHTGDIEIHGGSLDITGGKEAAGIGAGLCTKTVATVAHGVIIYGGTIKAQGGKYGAGIGGGGSYAYSFGNVSHGAVFRLYGGDVTATGGDSAAGVGGGSNYDKFEYKPGGGSGDCRIYGGKLTAQGGHRGAGIGGGSTKQITDYKTNPGQIHISGGTVNATGGKYGAGIGGGCNYSGGTINISGGTVTAIGGVDGAGIGGGEDGAGGTVNISGGTVRAEGRSYGAGIGGGDFYGGDNDFDSPTYSIGATVTITGGTIIAIAGEDCYAREDKGGCAIGCGQGMNHKEREFRVGKLQMPDNYRVTAGDAENSIERVFTSGERVDACHWRNYVKIEPCDHATPTVGSDREVALTYSVDDNTYHTQHCRYCNYTLQEMHDEAQLCKCGKSSVYRFTVYNPGTEKDTYTERSTIAIGAGMEFYLPSCSEVPEGYTFKGWEMNPDPEGGNKWAAILGEDLKEIGESVKTYVGQTPVSFYPRFLYIFTDNWTWADDGSTASVTLSHADLDPVTLASTDDTPQVTITPADLTDEDDDSKVIGTRYTATCTYTLHGYDYTFTDHKDVLMPEPEVEVAEVTLQDDGDNSETLETYSGQEANVTLPRTLYKDGSWNTLCLPFSLGSLDGTPLEGATVKTLASSSFEDGTLTLNFTDAVTAINAGTPYIVKWETTGDNLVNPVFEGVTISETQASTAGTAYIDLVGSFAPFTFTADDKSTLYLGDGNQLYYPTKERTMGACRAYFQLHNGLSVGNLNAARIVLNFGEGETTGVKEITDPTPHPTPAWGGSGCAWYDLQGRRIDGRPTKKGIYIRNGKIITTD